MVVRKNKVVLLTIVLFCSILVMSLRSNGSNNHDNDFWAISSDFDKVVYKSKLESKKLLSMMNNTSQIDEKSTLVSNKIFFSNMKYLLNYEDALKVVDYYETKVNTVSDEHSDYLHFLLLYAQKLRELNKYTEIEKLQHRLKQTFSVKNEVYILLLDIFLGKNPDLVVTKLDKLLKNEKYFFTDVLIFKLRYYNSTNDFLNLKLLSEQLITKIMNEKPLFLEKTFYHYVYAFYSLAMMHQGDKEGANIFKEQAFLDLNEDSNLFKEISVIVK